MTKYLSAALSLSVFCCLPWSATQAADCKSAIGTLVTLEGAVEIMANSSPQWHRGELNTALCKGDTIRVGERSRAAVALVNEAVLRIDQNTTLRLVDISTVDTERSWLDLLEGAFQSFSRRPRQLTINTPYLNGSIEGTEFVLRVENNTTQLTVFEGMVIAANQQGQRKVPGGTAVVARAGQPPQSIFLAKPREQVQWALYYPPVLAAGESSGAIVHAAHLMAVGRVDEARPIIEQLINTEKNSAKAYALRAVLNVVQDHLDQALIDAEKAVRLEGGSAGSVALSYVLQAKFQLIKAKTVLQNAAAKYPADALIWSRFAEVELMLGNRGEAIIAAHKASTLAPTLARSHVVLGFAELAAYHNDSALAAFQRAIQLDSADPLAHLGLGLATISAGDLHSGRQHIEVAVSLDGSSALLRAYLGKAYFEEKRSPLDKQQFDIAKMLDPNDPTAFLYDGIRKQTENKPIDALADLEQSIALNDNRAVYRSRLLLDKDRAARGVSLARAYNDLGFTPLGVTEATRSIATDPANAAAHRFLSDVYQHERRREIARVSELFQAQMLQELNINPVQPSSSEVNLNIVTLGGPASAGFNEFSPLFQRNETRFNLSGLGGSQGTRSAEAAVSGLYDRYAFSLGALNYDTEGWRPNNALEQEVYNGFFQAALSEQVTIQAELRQRTSTEGDLAFNFDPDDYQADKTLKRELKTARLGLRYSPVPQSHYLLSYGDSQREEWVRESQLQPPVVGITTLSNSSAADEAAKQFEAQFLHTLAAMNLVVGAAWSELDRVNNINLSVDDSIIGNLFARAGQEQSDSTHPRVYSYLNIRSGQTATWTLGASYERFGQGDFKESEFNPKLGLQWDLPADLRLRVAAFQSIKPALVGNRTLEPTQIAGFNQLFDDINGTRSRRYGLGLDWRASRTVTSGIELSTRTLDEPLFDGMNSVWITEERKEQYHQLYGNWALSQQLALDVALVYDQYESAIGIATEGGNLPENVTAWRIPVSLNYFAPFGVFAGLGSSYVDQSVRRSLTATQASGEDQFVTVDASVGYRLAQRRGLLSLAIRNLFDTRFNYQDDSYREFRDEPSIGPYFPVRNVVARLVLNY